MVAHKTDDSVWTPAQRDYALEQLWGKLEDIPMDPVTERMEAKFLHFPVGTDRKDIWCWFNKQHRLGLAYLLYGENTSYAFHAEQLSNLTELCPKCNLKSCSYHYSGICYVPLILSGNPRITENSQCSEYVKGDST